MTEPKERPILFAAPMVLAILAGRKTVTRRVLKPQPTRITSNAGKPIWHMKLRAGFINSTDEHTWPATMTRAHRDQDGNVYPAVCPYGSAGERLWVRERWRTARKVDADSPATIAKKAREAGYERPWAPIRYEADGATVNWDVGVWGEPGKSRVSLHMPRWASRLTLEVVSVRVERLHDITEEDARAEGIEGPGPGVCDSKGTPGYSVLNVGTWSTAREAFSFLWEAINGPESWEANPWTWVVNFRRLP